MPDLDQLLSSDIADIAADAVEGAPDLTALRARGARRRRVRRTALAGVAAAAVVAVIGIAQLPGAERSSPTDPAPNPLPDPIVNMAKVTPEQIVDHPRAKLTEAVVSPTDPDLRASVWQLCGGHRCGYATALTADGFETRIVIRGGQSWELTPLGSRGFLYNPSGLGTGPHLLTPDGSASPIGVYDLPPGPLADGEVAVGIPGSGLRWIGWLGLDPDDGGAAHRLSVPDGVEEFFQQADGRLEITKLADSGTAFQWSDNGGASWETHPLPGRMVGGYEFVPSAQPETLAVVEGGGFDQSQTIHVSRDGGKTWEQLIDDERPRGYGAILAVLPDGRLLAQLPGWSDDRPTKPADRSHEFYVGSDWSDLEPVEMGAPFTADQAPRGPEVLAVHADSEGVTIYAESGDDLFRTTDNGVTWDEVRAR